MNIRVTAIGALLLVGAASLRADTPSLVEQGGLSFVVWNGDKLVELTANRRLRFRSSGHNNRWVGVEKNSMDLAWSYRDVSDYVFESKSFRAENNSFVLDIRATKPSVRGRVEVRLEGRLISPEAGFEYKLSSTLTAAQKEWREVSHLAKDRKPSDKLELEFLDYHISRISQADLVSPRLPFSGETELYDGFVVSQDGRNWTLIPKVPLPDLTREGRYPTVDWNRDTPAKPGYSIGYLDRREGGWVTELLEASAPLTMTMCWMYYDLHHILPEGVPSWTAGKDTFTANYALSFRPVMPGQARELLDRAKPLEWRTLPEYQLPVFRRYSTFSEMLSGNSQYPWLASSYKCDVDKQTGYDDNASIRIRHDSPSDDSAWWAWTWGPGFENTPPLTGKYRFSAMVKTEGCKAPFRLAVAEFLHDLWFRDGKWSTNPGHPDKVLWHYSPGKVTGTSDWTRLTLDLPIDNETLKSPVGAMVRRGVVLQYRGEGTVWVDNVRIEKID